MYAAKGGHTEVVRCLLERELASIKQASPQQASHDQEASTQQKHLNPIPSCIQITSKVYMLYELVYCAQLNQEFTPRKLLKKQMVSYYYMSYHQMLSLPLHHYDITIVSLHYDVQGVLVFALNRRSRMSCT